MIPWSHSLEPRGERTVHPSGRFQEGAKMGALPSPSSYGQFKMLGTYGTPTHFSRKKCHFIMELEVIVSCGMGYSLLRWTPDMESACFELGWMMEAAINLTPNLFGNPAERSSCRGSPSKRKSRSNHVILYYSNFINIYTYLHLFTNSTSSLADKKRQLPRIGLNPSATGSQSPGGMRTAWASTQEKQCAGTDDQADRGWMDGKAEILGPGGC